MKKYLTIITILLASLLIGCNESSTAPDYNEPTSSSSQLTQSSTSTPIITYSSSQAIQYSASTPIVTYSSASTQTTLALYVGEIGFVCNGFNTDAVSSYKATEGYMAMYNICGDRATMTTGTQPRLASVLNDWMINDLELNESLRILIVNDVNTYGSSLRFYDAVDGYLRYIYIEPYGDGLGLMKKKI